MNLFNILKNKNYTFRDGTKILFSGRGGLTYIDQVGTKHYFGWLWDDNPTTYHKYNKKIDLLFDIEDQEIIKKLVFYCTKYKIKFKINDLVQNQDMLDKIMQGKALCWL